MYIEQLYTSCLAQAAYYIESEGEAVIIDPLRDVDAYIEKASSRNATIKYIFETHFHADFVSGHIDLAKKTGATIVFGPNAQTSFAIHQATDGEKIQVGNITFEVLHTPGHTPESTCYLLYDEKGVPHSIYTGDTVFVGDVGRPDLLDGVMTKEELAGMMYDSLTNKIKPLADDIILYPAHGPGSACGKNIGKETFSTLGEQKKMNYALQDMPKDEFIKKLTDGIAPAPAYFFADAKLNKAGYRSFDEVVTTADQPLAIADFEKETANGAIIIDTRKPDDFENGFIPGAINVGLNGQFAIWAASVIDIKTPVVLVCDEGTEKEAITRLARTGFDAIKGFLKGGYNTWKAAGKEYDMVLSVEPDELEMDYKHGQIQVLDVRKEGEYTDGHVKNAEWITLQSLPQSLDKLSKDTDYYVHCAGGYRSMVAASILKANGFTRVRNVYGGFGKIKLTGIPLETVKAAPKASASAAN